MTPSEIVRKVRDSGGQIFLADGKLTARRVPASLVPLLRERKSEIVAHLDRESASGSDGYQCPTQAPKVDQNANIGPLRASVRCGDCQHYQPDSVNPPQGSGRCALTLTGLPPAPVRGYGVCYPFSLRYCAHFQPLEDKS